MVNKHGNKICGEMLTLAFSADNGSGLKEKYEAFYCTLPPGHQGNHVAVGDELSPDELKGKVLKTWAKEKFKKK